MPFGGFTAELPDPEEPLPPYDFCMMQVDTDIYVDPERIVAIKACGRGGVGPSRARLLLDGGHELDLSIGVDETFRRLAAGPRD